MIALINSSAFDNFNDNLDSLGRGSARLSFPALPPEAVGVVMHFAFSLNLPWDFASNAVSVEIVP